jgi:hypothetical protein
MKTVKHVGKLKNTGTKVAVAFRTIPGESDQALVINVTTLPDAYHDSMMKVLESEQAADAFELGELLFIRTFSDGRPMLKALEQDGRLQRVPTDLVIMTPAPGNEVALDQLNVLIAQQKNCTVDELCTFVSGAPKTSVKNLAEVNDVTPLVDPDIPAEIKSNATTTEALTDKDLAKSYRSQADALYKEAAKLRKQADELDPPQKKTTKTSVETAGA